jgi:hypothetical protein
VGYLYFSLESFFSLGKYLLKGWSLIFELTETIRFIYSKATYLDFNTDILEINGILWMESSGKIGLMFKKAR